MATTATWQKLVGGHKGTKGIDVSVSGGYVPSDAVIKKVTFSVGLSVDPKAGSYTQLYYISTPDKGTVFYGSSTSDSSSSSKYYSRQKTSVFNNHSYYEGNNGIQRDWEQNLNWVKGKSGGKIRFRVNNSGAGASYVRGTRLVISYYVRCTDPYNVSANGGFQSLSASWVLGASGAGDTATNEVCYNTSKTWNSATASTVTTTSKSWTITTPGTYYVGVRVTGSETGTHSVVWSNAATVYSFSATYVVKGNLIKATDYNQIRNRHSGLTAMTAGSSIVDDANITAVRNYSSGVVSATVGGTVTADYFNNSVLAKIT